jgi:hypothetical protein
MGLQNFRIRQVAVYITACLAVGCCNPMPPDRATWRAPVASGIREAGYTAKLPCYLQNPQWTIFRSVESQNVFLYAPGSLSVVNDDNLGPWGFATRNSFSGMDVVLLTSYDISAFEGARTELHKSQADALLLPLPIHSTRVTSTTHLPLRSVAFRGEPVDGAHNQFVVFVFASARCGSAVRILRKTLAQSEGMLLSLECRYSALAPDSQKRSDVALEIPIHIGNVQIPQFK